MARPAVVPSPEQYAIIDRDWPGGVATADIVAAVNAAGEMQIDAKRLYSIARYRKLLRPKGWVSLMLTKYYAETRGPRDNAIRLKLREVYQWGFSLDLPLDQRGDIEAVSAAMRKQDAAHPGFVLASKFSGQWRAP